MSTVKKWKRIRSLDKFNWIRIYTVPEKNGDALWDIILAN